MKKILLFVLGGILFLSGCQASSVSKIQKGEPKFVKGGFGSYVEKTDGITRVTYAGIAFDKDNKITFLSIDENAIELGNQKSSLLSKKELGNNNGLSLQSDKGDWKDQMKAFENYVVGNHLTKEELMKISLDNLGKPTDRDLSVACELSLTHAFNAIKSALNQLTDIDGYSAAIAQNFTHSSKEGKAEITLSFVVKNYFNKVDYIYFDQYILDKKSDMYDSQRKNADWLEQINYLEEYITGTEVGSFVKMQTYDKGDGIYNSLPIKNSDLHDKFKMNLNDYQFALAKIGA